MSNVLKVSKAILLSEKPLRPPEIAESSGLPIEKVYPSLQFLRKKGFIHSKYCLATIGNRLRPSRKFTFTNAEKTRRRALKLIQESGD